MKTKRNLILTGLLCAALLPAVGPAQTFTYTTNADGTLNVYKFSGYSFSPIAIPNTVYNLRVTTIGTNAFYQSQIVVGLTFGTNITTVRSNAFWQSQVMSVTLDANLTSIGDFAFSGCSLTNIIIPDSVTNIGSGAFGGSSFIESIMVNTNNPAYCSVNGVLFNKSGTTLVECPREVSGYTIPNSVTSIGDYAFSGSDLTNIVIPDSVTSIGDNAFYLCYSLPSVTIPNSVTNIGAYALSECDDLTKLIIGANVSSIGDYAFYYSYSLGLVCFQGDAPVSIGTNLFLNAYPTVYYLPGTTGWQSGFAGRPTALWFLPNPMILNNEPGFGAQAGGFGFTISWATNIPVMVDACADLASPAWSPVGTNTLTNGSSYFSDPQWGGYPARFYRLRSP